jgi:predicted metalloprotease with PDZ domain
MRAMLSQSPKLQELRGLVGGAPSDALLLTLLQRHDNNPAAAASAYRDHISTIHAASAAATPVSMPASERLALAYYTYHFKPGRIGAVLQDSVDGIKVVDVEPGTQADAAGVPLLSTILAVNGKDVGGLTKVQLGARVTQVSGVETS